MDYFGCFTRRGLKWARTNARVSLNAEEIKRYDVELYSYLYCWIFILNIPFSLNLHHLFTFNLIII